MNAAEANSVTVQRVRAILRRAGYTLARLSADRTYYSEGVQIWKSARRVGDGTESFIAIHYLCTPLVNDCPFGENVDACNRHGDEVEAQCLALLAAAGIDAEHDVQRVR